MLFSAGFIWQIFRKDGECALVAAALLNAALLISVSPLVDQNNLNSHFQQFIQSIGYCVWVLAISFIKQFQVEKVKASFKAIFWISWIISLFVFVSNASGYVFALTWVNFILLIQAFVTLYCIERLMQIVKLELKLYRLCLFIGVILIFDVMHKVLALTDLEFFTFVDAIMPFLYVIAAIIMFLLLFSYSKKSQAYKFKLKKKSIYYGSTLITSSLLISLIIVLFSFIDAYELNIFNVLITVLILSFSFVLLNTLISLEARNQLRVFINKVFFSYKYDYRSEWLRVTSILSSTEEDICPEERSLEALVSPLHAHSGALWIKNGNCFTPSIDNSSAQLDRFTIAGDDPMCLRMVSDEWVFNLKASPNSPASTFNDELPIWCDDIKDLWLLIPLVVRDELIGFATVLSDSKNAELTWEDLDMIKIVSGQVSSYLKLHLQEKELEEKNRIQLYYQLSSFIMHDLNNLIAQQSLVVKNAEKHINNPAFVADAIETVNHSVTRMKSLLFKLKNNQAENNTILDLVSVIQQAITSNESHKPTPSFKSTIDTVHVIADEEKLLLSISHLIKNAQEATDDKGSVTVDLSEKKKTIEITVQDTGKGMDEAFINSCLYRPFKSTKQNKGMGIGVYLTKEYIEQLGGSITVKSEIDVGTTFILSLPKCEKP